MLENFEVNPAHQMQFQGGNHQMIKDAYLKVVDRGTKTY